MSMISSNWKQVYARVETLMRDPIQFDMAMLYRNFWERIFVNKMGEFGQGVGRGKTLLWETTDLGQQITMRKKTRDSIGIRAKWYAADLEVRDGMIWGAHAQEVRSMEQMFARILSDYRTQLHKGNNTEGNPGWTIP